MQRLDRFDRYSDVLWPFITLQWVQNRTLLQIGDHHNLPQTLERFANGIGQKLCGVDKGLSESRCPPTWGGFAQFARCQLCAICEGSGIPLFQGYERNTLGIECIERSLIEWRSFAQKEIDFVT